MIYRVLAVSLAISGAAACTDHATAGPQSAPPAAETASRQAGSENVIRTTGVITEITPASLTIQQANGTSATFQLAESYNVMRAKTVDIEAIQPGTYVATANTNIDEASGKSIELRMYDQSARMPEFSRPMAEPNTTMTNGTVRTITKGAGGRELEVAYAGGVRKIIVPPDVQVIGNFPATHKDLQPGVTVNIVAEPVAEGSAVARRVTIAASAS